MSKLVTVGLDTCMFLAIITNKCIFGWHFSSENMKGGSLHHIVENVIYFLCI